MAKRLRMTSAQPDGRFGALHVEEKQPCGAFHEKTQKVMVTG